MHLAAAILIGLGGLLLAGCGGDAEPEPARDAGGERSAEALAVEPDAGPEVAPSPALPCEPPLLFGHRGTILFAPENTLPAYHYAIDSGGDGIEVDLRATRDGHLVALHDSRIGRTTDAAEDLPVGEVDLAALQALDAGSWFDPAFAGTRVPSLEDVIDAFPSPGVQLLFDLKSLALVAPLVDAIGEHGLEARSVVSSPDLAVLARLAEALPEVPALYYPGSLDELPQIDVPTVRYVRVPKEIEEDPAHVATIRDAGLEAAISGRLIQWQGPDTAYTALGLVNNMALTAERRVERRPEVCAGER